MKDNIKTKTFRIWYKSQYGLAIETRKAKTLQELKGRLPKKVILNLIEIEQL